MQIKLFLLLAFIAITHKSVFSQEKYYYGNSSKVGINTNILAYNSHSTNTYYFSIKNTGLTSNNEFENFKEEKISPLTDNPDIKVEKGIITDKRDGKKYKTIKIGNQTWMAENLNFTSTGYCWCYKDSIKYCNKYGRLYDWNAAMESCPSGWHLPSDEEWNTLANLFGGEEHAGGKFKTKTDWIAPNTDATDSIGFTALPGGFRLSNGEFLYIHKFGSWWTSTESDKITVINRGLTYSNGFIYRSYYSKNYGRSVRCVKNSQ